ncbi:hypothetical protein P3T23_006150 [Paraburkholderia sp. GAS448]
MKGSAAESRIFVVLVCVGLAGLPLRIWVCKEIPSSLVCLIAPICSDVLLFFGSVGGIGLLCLKVFGPAQVERTHAWVSLAAVVAASILFVWGV